MPAMFLHSINVYNTMRTEAAIVEWVSGGRMLVWEGFLTKLTRGLGLSTPYYTAVRRDLTRMGCIRQLRRGGGSSPSQWELIKAPTEDLYKNSKVQPTKEKTRLDTIMQQIKDVHTRLTVVEQQIDTIISAVNMSVDRSA